MTELAFQIIAQIMNSGPENPEDYAMINGVIVSNDFYQRVEELTHYLTSIQSQNVEVCHEF